MRSPDEMRADAERAQALGTPEPFITTRRGNVKLRSLAEGEFIAAASTAVPILASDVLSLLAERDAPYRNGKRAGLISAAEYLEHEAALTEANRDRATDEEHRRAYTVQAGIYRSAALVCRSRAAVAAPEAEDEIAKLRAEIDALKQGVYLWQFF